jgi:hypothetical protein
MKDAAAAGPRRRHLAAPLPVGCLGRRPRLLARLAPLALGGGGLPLVAPFAALLGQAAARLGTLAAQRLEVARRALDARGRGRPGGRGLGAGGAGHGERERAAQDHPAQPGVAHRQQPLQIGNGRCRIVVVAQGCAPITIVVAGIPRA